jgi:CheY-like chemotaxis protein
VSETEPAIVLVVEDEPLVRLFVEEILSEDGGYRVITAADADEALMILKGRPEVRLVFTDINMPGSMNGLELAHTVQARWPGVEVLVTSGAGLSGALPSGSRFLQKPSMPRVLLAAVRDMLARTCGPTMRAPVMPI